MNEIGITLLWIALQVSLLSLVSTGVYLLVRRGRPIVGASAVAAGLMMVIVVTLLAVLPWSGWNWDRAADEQLAESTVSPSTSIETAGADGQSAKTRDLPENGSGSLKEDIQLESTLAAFTEGFLSGLRQPVPQQNRSLQWTGWLSITLLVSLSVGLLRLLLGLFWVRRCRLSGEPIVDADLQELLDVIRAESYCSDPIELRVAADVASAATVGWRRPIILLPKNWRDWSREEQRSVLAHEVAHVAHRDSLYWMLAQVGLLLHFYHPLVHWLTGRLRLEQELAADESAAQIVGDRRQYLTTLAELAVRQPDRPLAWPARTFLPTRGTLLRRIDMLRSTQRLESTKTSNVRRFAAVAVTVMAGLTLAGFRPPESQQAHAQGKTTLREQASTGDANEFNLRYVPPGVAVLLGVRPEAFAGLDSFEPVTPQVDLLIEKLGFSVEDVSQVLVMIRPGGDQRPVEAPVVEVRTKQSHDFSKVIKSLAGETEERTSAGGISYLHPVAGSDVACWVADDQTLLVGDEEELVFLIDSTKSGPVLPSWRQEFAQVAGGHFCCLVDVARLRPVIERTLSKNPTPVAGMFQPLWTDTKLLLIGGTLSSTTTLNVNAWCHSAEGAQRMLRTTDSLVTLGQNFLEQQRTKFDGLPAEAQGAMSILVGRIEDMLDTSQTEQKGARVTASFKTEQGSIPVMMGLLLPAVQQAREAARRAQSSNNLKQIAIALHNYHDVYGHFPAPAVFGQSANGKSQHPHSWRVAILPFVEGAALYDEYHFDEPWDSEQNKKILKQMPAVFRNPKDKAQSTKTAYFCLVGEHTALGNKPELGDKPGGTGVQIRDFTDGTSNTLAIVEAKRDIPWTKPEDIPYSPGKDLPKLGGFWAAPGFFACLADGSVRYIHEEIDESTLRNLITRDDGNPIVPSESRR